MTPEQAAALKTFASADQAAAALIAAGDDAGLAGWFNAPASPTFVVWRSSLSRAEILHTASPDATLFKWNGNGYITRSQGERDAFREIFDATGNINPSLPNVQAAISDIFSGTGNAQDNRQHIASHSKRQATRAERFLASGVGSTASPGTMTLEGILSPGDASQVRVA